VLDFCFAKSKDAEVFAKRFGGKRLLAIWKYPEGEEREAGRATLVSANARQAEGYRRDRNEP